MEIELFLYTHPILYYFMLQFKYEKNIYWWSIGSNSC